MNNDKCINHSLIRVTYMFFSPSDYLPGAGVEMITAHSKTALDHWRLEATEASVSYGKASGLLRGKMSVENCEIQRLRRYSLDPIEI